MSRAQFKAEATAVADFGTLDQVLEWMKLHGSSVILNWGEDTGAWECYWISGGERSTGHGLEPKYAAIEAIRKRLYKMDSQ